MIHLDSQSPTNPGGRSCEISHKKCWFVAFYWVTVDNTNSLNWGIMKSPLPRNQPTGCHGGHAVGSIANSFSESQWSVFLSLFDVTWGFLNQQLVSNLFICMKGSAVLKNLHDSPLITFNYGVLGKDPRCHIDWTGVWEGRVPEQLWDVFRQS